MMSNHAKEELMLQGSLCNISMGWIVLQKKLTPMGVRVGTRDAKSTSQK
jgi:hypothetical protein